MDETQDDQQVLETADIELDLDLEDSSENTDEISVDVDALKQENEELKKKNKQLFERAKKQEPKEETKESSLSQKDVIYLAKADIHESDMDEVVELAKLKKISVAEAHKYMTPILAERNEERRTQNAMQTKGGARGASKTTPDMLISKAERGEEVDADALAEARMKIRLGQIK